MAASVRIEDEAFSDERYEDLAAYAGLADSDHARGKMARLWRQCTLENRHTLTTETVVRILGPNGVAALTRARLGEAQSDALVRIRGTRGRIEWLEKMRKNGRKGGRPKKTKSKPTGFPDSNPPAPAPAPAPAPTIPEPREPPRRARDPGTPVPTYPPSAPPTPSGDGRVAHGGADGQPDPDPRETQRRAILRSVSQLHREVFERTRIALGSDARPMALVGDPAERALSAHLSGLVSLDQAEADCRHVLAVREAEALRTRSVRFLGSSVWSEVPFARAKDLSPQEAAATAAARGGHDPQAQLDRQLARVRRLEAEESGAAPAPAAPSEFP